MGYSRHIIHRDRFKRYFIAASTIIVMALVLLTDQFNRTALEKLWFDAHIAECRIDAGMLSEELQQLADTAPKEEGAAVHAILRQHQQQIDRRLDSGPGPLAGRRASGGTGVAVSLISPNGLILDSTDPEQNKTRIPFPVLKQFQGQSPGDAPAGHVRAGETVYLGRPIGTVLAGGGTYGMISFEAKPIADALADALGGERGRFWTLFWAAALLMIIALCCILPGQQPLQSKGRKTPGIIVAGFCIAFQILFSVLFAAEYRAQLLTLVRMEAGSARIEFVRRLASSAPDSQGPAPKHGFREKRVSDAHPFPRHLQDAAARAIGSRQGISAITVTFDSGPRPEAVVVRSPAPQGGEPHPGWSVFRSAMAAVDSTDSSDSSDSFWGIPGVGSGKWRAVPSEVFLARMLSEMAMDIITALAISILMLIELLILMAAVFDARSAGAARKSAPCSHTLMRPAAFFLLFAIDLSMSFIPIYMARLYEPMMGLPRDVVLGLPITVEFIFVGLAIFGSGYWVDRRGWHEPFLAGLFFTAIGLLCSWLAPDAVHFILSRGLVGIGYGLALMAAQGFVITFTDFRTKAFGLAQLFAGIYAGSICGGAAGGMLAERFGFSAAFLAGAVIIIGVAAYTALFMRHTMKAPSTPKASASGGAAPSPAVQASFPEFIRNRIVVSLILLSSLPASIAVVGFLNYFCPLYLNSLGVSQSSIGRILMIYGISLVYFGPIIGKYTDRSDDKRMFVFAGCILGSLTFLLFHAVQGIFAAVLALLFLGLSSCFVISSQSAYLLSLRVTRHFGHGKAIGIFRSTSRIGQALGPIVFGGLILAQNLERGVILFGLIYLITALLFFLTTRQDRRHYIEETA